MCRAQSTVDQNLKRPDRQTIPNAKWRCVRSASRIALLRPGDLFICSGGVAHATVSAVAQVKGSEEPQLTCHEAEAEEALRVPSQFHEASKDVSVTGYESLVSLHPRQHEARSDAARKEAKHSG